MVILKFNLVNCLHQPSNFPSIFYQNSKQFSKIYLIKCHLKCHEANILLISDEFAKIAEDALQNR